jgi:MFS transporter, DHA2 family, multidrug resistance protein
MSAHLQTFTSRPAPALNGATLWTAGILLAAANFLAVLDVTIANVSVANISGSLGVSNSQGLWVITSYAVAEAITVPLTGWLAGRFGAVRVFIAAMLGFGLFSALCGLSTSLEMLVLFRVLQGFAGGPLMPLSQTLLLHIFPKQQQPMALALWAMTTLVAPVLGPILGGVLCDNFGWPSIFLVNVPVAFLAAPVLAWLLMSAETPTARTRIDGIGLALLIVWVGALQIMLDLGKDHDWFESSMIVALAAVAVVGFAAFLIWELTDSDPIVALRIFRHRGFATAMVTLALAFGAFFATNVITPLWLQSNMGYTATWAGYVTGTLGVTAIFAAPIASLLSNRIDPRKIVFAGMLWLALAILMRGSVTPEETASAAGLMSFIRTLSGAFATSIANTVWENGAASNQADLAATLNDAQETVNVLMQTGMGHDQAVSSLTQMVQGQAMMLSTNQMFMSCVVVFLIAAASIWLVPKPTRVADASLAH